MSFAYFVIVGSQDNPIYELELNAPTLKEVGLVFLAITGVEGGPETYESVHGSLRIRSCGRNTMGHVK
jgi:hypothetical protein